MLYKNNRSQEDEKAVFAIFATDLLIRDKLLKNVYK